MTRSSEPARRRYAGSSADERRAERRAKIVDATLDATLSDGVAGLTVGAVCAQASLSKRYFYESFDSLDTVLAVTLTEGLAAAAARIDVLDLDRQAGFDRLTASAVDAILTVFDDPRVARLYLESAANPALSSARDRAVDGFVNQLLTIVRGDCDHPPASVMLAHVLVSGTTHVVGAWLRGESPLSRDDFVHHLGTLGARTAELIMEVDARAITEQGQ